MADGTNKSCELLAPAGNADALTAALEAGASAVYFGLTSLNARRRAGIFGRMNWPERCNRFTRMGPGRI